MEKFKKIVSGILCLLLLLTALAPAGAVVASENEKKDAVSSGSRVVKVGYVYRKNYSEGMSDQEHKSGYCYDYLQKIAMVTGWTYEYVYGSWNEIYNKLLTGEVDLMAGISKNEAREELMYFPTEPMEKDGFYIYLRTDRSVDINSTDALLHKKIGVVRNTIIETLLEKWRDENQLALRIVTYDGNEEMYKALTENTIDACAASDNVVIPIENMHAVQCIGNTDGYMVVAKSSPEVYEELEYAQNYIRLTSPFYFEYIHSLYFSDVITNDTLTTAELEWLANHKTIRVGYIADRMPYCGTDYKGNVTGQISVLIPAMFETLGLSKKIQVEYIEYADKNAMGAALEEDAVDLVFPVYGDLWFAEQHNVLISQAVDYGTQMLAFKGAYNPEIYRTIAIDQSSSTQEAYAKQHFPDSELVYFQNAEECLKAISNGSVASAIVDSYRRNVLLAESKADFNAIELPEKYGICFATGRANSGLLLLIDRGLRMMDSAQIQHSLYQFQAQQYTYTAEDFIVDNAIWLILAVSAISMAIVIIFISAYIKARRLSLTQQNQLMCIQALAKDYMDVFVIDLTTNSYSLIKANGEYTEGDGSRERKNLSNVWNHFVDTMIYVEDRSRIGDLFQKSSLLLTFKTQDEMLCNYRIQIHNDIINCQAVLRKLPGSTADRPLIIAGFRNVSEIVAEEKKQQKELADALAVAESANRAKSVFLHNMSHDIRTPMNAVIGYTNLLKRNVNNEQKRNDYIEKIECSSNSLLDLINNVLEMARIESGEMIANNRFVDPEMFGKSIIPIIEQMAAEKNQQFVCESYLEHPYLIYDELKVREICLNLLSNAVKYTPEGGTVSFIVNELPTDTPGCAKVQAIIKDTGIGMSEDYLPRLFDQFTREHTTTENNVVGTGLGMTIVKSLVDFMNGTIEVESELNVGTTFIVTLEHRIASEEEVEAFLKEKERKLLGKTENLQGKRVLLTEDNELNAEIATELLTDAGVLVERAADGTECVELIKKNGDHYYDLVLMDILMPKMNGYEATEILRNLGVKTPIIAMTANAFAEDKNKALECGMNGHISKPFSITKLLETIAETIVQKG